MAISLGRTPTEFRETATYEDFVLLMAYIRKRGPLDLGFRSEMHTALLAHIASTAAGGKTKMVDFMPHAEKPSDDVSLESMMRVLGAKRSG